MRIFAVTSYKGTNYQGWQRQTNAISVQEQIEKVLSRLLNTEIVIYGSGRTDAGVSAKGQTFHFDVNKDIDLEKLKYSANCLLPNDITILLFKEISSDFHARYSAIGKVYKYRIQLGNRNPFNYDTYTWIPQELNFNLLNESLQLFIGKHNFQDFTSKEEDENHFEREIFNINATMDEIDNTIEITFKGNGFMRYQIRFMVGTAIAIAMKKEDINFIKYHLESNKEREIISYKSPSNGLILESVIYK